MHKQRQGQFAENLACEYLSTQGLVLIQKNFLRRVGEIDLIMSDPASYATVLIEVRFRNNMDRGGPLESITVEKSRKLIQTAKLVQQQLCDPNAILRLDVIGICPAGVHNETQHLGLGLTGIDYALFQNHRITWVKNAIS